MKLRSAPSSNVVAAPPVDPMALLMFQLTQQERNMPRSIPPMQGDLAARPGRAAPIRERQAAAQDAATFGVQAKQEFYDKASADTRSLTPQSKGSTPMNQAPGSMPPAAPLLQAPTAAPGLAGPMPSQQNLLAILAALSGRPMGGGMMPPGGMR